MTHGEMRIKIAEACGYDYGELNGRSHWDTPTGERVWDNYYLPDYPNDLNACHEMEATLTREEQDKYANELYCLLPCDENHGPIGFEGEDIMTASMFPQNQRIDMTRRQLWNVWGPKHNIHGDHLIHAMEQTPLGNFPQSTLCGIPIGERWVTGLVKVPEETQPGCVRCRKKLHLEKKD